MRSPRLGALWALLRNPAVHSSGAGLAALGMEELAEGGRIFLGARTTGTDALACQALAVRYGGSPDAWRIGRTAHGRPYACDAHGRPVSLSASAAGCTAGIFVQDTGRVGIDLETIDRIALDTDPQDDWLDSDEQRLLATLDPPERLLEIGCRWMLREAYGKAVGLGLAAWGKGQVIEAVEGRICLHGDATARPGERWTFRLYRRDRMLLATACCGPAMSDRDAVGTGRQEPPDRARRQAQRPQHL